MKDEIRVLGIDDGYFLKHGDKKVLVVGAVLRGNKDLDGVLSCHIDKDGTDSTKRLIHLINNSKHKNQLRYIITNGTTLGGFNILDIKELYARTNVPVLAVLRKRPNQQKVERALNHFPDKKNRLERIRKAGEIYTYRNLYFQAAGLDESEAKELIEKTTKGSNIPEPVRVAHLIASGVTYGESTKRA
jgi:hypothetical protein